MRINMDCIRDILLCIEENTGLHQMCFFISYADAGIQAALGEDTIPPKSYQVELESRYAHDDIIYNLKYCVESELVVAPGHFPAYQNWIADLTPKGHEFLAEIRDEGNWKKIKQACSKIGAVSMDIILEVSKSVLLAGFNSFLKMS